MSLSSISMEQALGIWSDLCDALHGKNGFGGNTAEIYMYRLMPFDPSIAHGIGQEQVRAYEAAGRVACCALYDLLQHFSDTRTADIWVEEEKLGPWLREQSHHHRLHVRVQERGSVA